jgi:hypothetical protein
VAKEARYTAQIAALIEPETRAQLDTIVIEFELSFADVLRQTIDFGLPFLVKKYEALAAARDATPLPGFEDEAEFAPAPEPAVSAVDEETLRAARRG